MSGTRQHFVPQFLMRGFLDKTELPNEITHVYRKGLRHFATNIKNVGLENQFYGEPGSNSLDDRLTELEGRFANFINDLRLEEPFKPLDAQACAALCAHLAMRTRHLRLMSEDILQGFMDKIAFHYQTPEYREPIVRKLFERDAQELRRQMEEALVKNRDFQALSAQDQKQVVDLIIANPAGVVDMMAQGVTNGAPAMLQALREQMKSIVQGAHNKTLHQDGALIKHEEKLRELTWSVVSTDEPLILGDFLLLVKAGTRSNLVNYLMAQEVPREVFLPIAEHKLLVGCPPGQRVAEIDVPRLNYDIAANSFEHFVGPSKKDEYLALASHIGDILKTEMASINNMMEKIIQEQILSRAPKSS